MCVVINSVCARLWWRPHRRGVAARMEYGWAQLAGGRHGAGDEPPAVTPTTHTRPDPTTTVEEILPTVATGIKKLQLR